MATDAELVQRVKNGETEFTPYEFTQLMGLEKEVSEGPIKQQLKALLDTYISREDKPPVEENSEYKWQR